MSDECSYSPKGFYNVKEVDSEAEEEHEDLVDSIDYGKAGKIQATRSDNGSFIIDDDGEKFVECNSNFDEENESLTLEQAIEEDKKE
jgi:hypothetical protein